MKKIWDPNPWATVWFHMEWPIYDSLYGQVLELSLHFYEYGEIFELYSSAEIDSSTEISLYQPFIFSMF